MGRILKSRQVTQDVAPAVEFPFEYSYDFAGNMLTMKYPSGRLIQTDYDAVGRAQSVSKKAGTVLTAYATVTSFAPHGAITGMNLGPTTAPVSAETWSYNNRLQPTLTQVNQGGSAVLKLEYFYCATQGTACTTNNGNMLSQRITPASTEVYLQEYGYDEFNRLKEFTEKKNGTLGPTLTNNYDRYGNRWVTGMSGWSSPPATPGIPTAAGAFDTNNRLAGVGYDNAGNQVQFGADSAAYDGENRMVSYTGPGGTTAYAYGPGGERISTTVPAAGRTVFVYDASGTLAAEYSPGTVTDGLRYVSVDHLGSTRMLLASNGVLQQRYDYEPFGAPLRTGDNGRGAIYSDVRGLPRFTGQYRDSTTRLDYFGARYYSWELGRFGSADQAGPDVAIPQTLNKYRYALNNPLRMIDPDGLYETDVHRDLTYSLALAAGWNERAAWRAGTANQWVDDSPVTTPMPSLGSIQVEARRLYHFTTREQRAQLWHSAQVGASPESIGAFLHTQQDIYSHAGYGYRMGQVATWRVWDMAWPDKTFNEPQKADLMALDTFQILSAAGGMLDRAYGPVYQPLPWSIVSPFVKRFNRARTDKEKQKILGELNAVAQQNIERQSRAPDGVASSGVCKAEFSRCN